jgi:hypothetical protein
MEDNPVHCFIFQRKNEQKQKIFVNDFFSSSPITVFFSPNLFQNHPV